MGRSPAEFQVLEEAFVEGMTGMARRETVYIEYMGCPQRGLDARRFADYFVKNGLILSRTPRNADYVLFVSCAFRNTDEEFALKRIRELGRSKARLIVGGCLKGIHRERLEECFQGPAIETSRLEQIDRIFPDLLVKFRDIPDAHRPYSRSLFQMARLYAYSLAQLDFGFLKPVTDFLRKKSSGKSWYVRAAWGCVKEHCTYCSVWKGVGEYRSKPIEFCVQEFEEGLRRGYRHFLITADNLGAYGSDIGLSLPELLEQLIAVRGQYRVQLENVNPYWLIKYRDRFLSLFEQRRIHAMLCPIQSGNNRILGLMNRRHTVESAREFLLKVRTVCPVIELYTQIIVGFPSETDAEFEETLDLVREVGFNFVHISGYHRRPNQLNEGLIGHELTSAVIRKRIQKAVKVFKKNKIGYFAYPQ